MSKLHPFCCRSWFVVIVLAAVVTIGAVVGTGKAAPEPAKAMWQYRQVECMPNAVQATLEDLGRDGWEAFSVYGAATLTNEGGGLKQVPHTFYVFAKKPMER